jgi:hypothetical protein
MLLAKAIGVAALGGLAGFAVALAGMAAIFRSSGRICNLIGSPGGAGFR